jgi:hypothetical protein
MNKCILAGVVGCLLLVGPIVCHAEKWDKNNYKDRSVEAAYYDTDSIKVHGKAINFTVKCILRSDDAKKTTLNLSKYPTCKQSIDKMGDVAQYQQDYQIEDGKARLIAVRYYTKSDKVLCTDKDMGKEVNKSWVKITRNSPMQDIYYDLVTKYKVVVPK